MILHVFPDFALFNAKHTFGLLGFYLRDFHTIAVSCSKELDVRCWCPSFLSMMGYPKLTVSVLLAVLLTTSGAIKINPDGGYELVLAIDHNEPSPSSVSTYVQNIQDSLQTLSHRMFIATNEKFWLKTAEIIVPPSWSVNVTNVSTKSFSTADVRVSTNIRVPNAVNPNPCGLPGDSIELPTSFFQNHNTGEYGLLWKALLVLWTRYRWGAYDEHGYPGDETFPYFYPADNAANVDIKWLTTGCSNAPENQLRGSYKRLDGTACDPRSQSPLHEACRFYPSRTENFKVTSSLMHFHWMESVTHFCDEKTHKKDVPNKQNLYCEYKSVMETILNSPDAKAVTAPVSFVKVTQITISKPSVHPALYILLDNGEVSPDAANNMIKTRVQLGQLFASGIPKDIVAALGTYPSSQSLINLKQEVDFTIVRDNEDPFIKVIGDYTPMKNAPRDFARAIEEAANAISKINPINGGAILVLKTANTSRNSELFTEKDVELRLQKQNISLFAVEGTPDLHLERLASLSKGRTVDVRDMTAVGGLLNQVVQFVSGETSPALKETQRLVWIGDVEMGKQVSIPVVENTEMLTFMFVTAEKRNISDVFAGVYTEVIDYGADFTESYEFADTDRSNNRYIYTGMLNTTVMKVRQVEFRVQGIGSGRLFVFSQGSNLPEGILKAEVFTSAIGTVNLTAVENPYAPFVIYSKITFDGAPVVDAEAIANIVMEGTDEVISVALKDDGDGNGDSAEGDGIYSSVFVPPKDGRYGISVTVTKGQVLSKSPNPHGYGLIPTNQEFPSPPLPVELPKGLVESASLSGAVQFTGRDDYNPVIQRNLDAEIEKDESSVIFELKVPEVLGSNNVPKEYRVYRSRNKSELINANLNQDLPTTIDFVLPYMLPEDAKPGQSLRIPYDDDRDGVYYYALAAWDGNSHSSLSNILRVDESMNDGTTGSSSATVSTTVVTSTDVSGASDGATGSTVSGPAQTTEESGSSESTTQGEESDTTIKSPEETKPWIKSGGGIATIVIIIVVVFVTATGAYVYFQKKRSVNVSTSSSSLNREGV